MSKSIRAGKGERKMSIKLAHTKYGLKYDPRGIIVKMEYQGRTLLGRIRAVERNQVTGAIELTISHFCGDLWPIKPTSYAVDIV